jgi:hypothetical protein
MHFHELLPEQLLAYQEERWHALQDGFKRGAARPWGKIAGKRAAVEARLADLHQRESALGVDPAATADREGWQLPTFAKASQNVVVAATLLDTQHTPPTNGVGEVYQRLKSILGTTIVQQAESTFQHRVEASISTPDHSKTGG